MDSKVIFIIVMILCSFFFSSFSITNAQTSTSFQLTESSITAGANSTSSGFRLLSSIGGIAGFLQSSGFQIIAGFLPLSQGGLTIPTGLFPSGIQATVSSDGSYIIPLGASSGGTTKFAQLYTVSASGSTASITMDRTFSFTDSGSLGATTFFQSGTQITADSSSWDGQFSNPTDLSAALVTAPGGGTVSKAIRIGSTTLDFTFSQPMRLTFTGKAGQNVALTDKNSVTTEITTVCNGVDFTTVSSQLGNREACKINNNADLIVWTKRASDYFTFAAASDGGGGGGTTMYTDPPSFTQNFKENEHPLVIGDTIFSSVGYYNEKTKTALVNTGIQVPFRLLMYENHGPQNVQHVALYMNLHGLSNTEVHNADTWLVYEKNKGLEIHDPHGFIDDAYTAISTKGNKFEISFYITFAKPMQKSNLIIVAWNYERNSMTSKIPDAFEVKEPATTASKTVAEKPKEQVISTPKIEITPEPGVDIVPEPGVEVATTDQKETIQKWAGYHTVSASDSDLLKALNIKVSADVDSQPKLPKWTKNNLAKWVINDKISMKEFHDAINHIIKKIKS